MARHLDELVDFLVAEIASTGPEGCTQNEVSSFIHRFYASSASERGRINKSTEQTYDALKSATIDRISQEQVWKLLIQRPNVSVGRERPSDALSLSGIEAVHAGDHERVTVSACRTTPSLEATNGGAAAVSSPETSGVSEDTTLGTEANLRTDASGLYEVVAGNLERDEFGFLRRPQPTLQHGNGQASLEDGLRAANLSDLRSSAGDLVAVGKENAEYVVEELNHSVSQDNDDYCATCGDAGELICCDGCPNAFHGTCLEPPVDPSDLLDDQWYCPHCETNGVPNDNTRDSLRRESATSAAIPSSMSKTVITPRRTLAKRKQGTKPRGRPRKFLPGTEQFWRTQFPKKAALFASRPPNFDATLLRALHNGLPTPIEPVDISESWINKALTILNRSAHGLYISSRGNLQRGSGTRMATSQIMIFRSARLREVDFSNGRELSAVRFLSSSAAHTFNSLRYYPQAKASGHPSRAGGADSVKTRTISTLQTPARQQGPKLGIFYDDTYQHQNLQHNSFVPSAASRRRNSGHSVSTIDSPVGVDNVDLQSQPVNSQPVLASSSNTVPSQSHSLPEVARAPRGRGLAQKLPPPLTTRAASKRHASKLDGFITPRTGALQDVANSERPSAKSPVPEMSLLQEGQSRKQRPSSFGNFSAFPTKRGKKYTTDSSLASMRQQIILEIIERCDGAIPDNSLLLWNAVSAAWHKSGQAGVPDKRTVDLNLKALCTAGKIKKSTFSFKDHRGLMVVSSILAKPEVRQEEPIMRQLQKNIINVYPNQYTPPGMFAGQAADVDGNLGPQLDIRLPSRQGKRARQGETPSSSVLPTVEKETPKPGKNMEFVPSTQEVARRGPLETTVSVEDPSIFVDSSGPRSSPGTFGGGLAKDVSFHMRQERPIVFDAIASSSLSGSTSKHAENNKKVIWRNSPRTRAIPRSLEDILREGPRRQETGHYLTEGDPYLRRFESEVDSVARWEERSFNRFQDVDDLQSWNFISHFVNQNFQAVRMENIPVQFNGLTWYDKSGREKVYLPATWRRLWASPLDSERSPAMTSSIRTRQLDASITMPSRSTRASGMSPRASNLQSGPSTKRKRKAAKAKPSKRRKVKDSPPKPGKTELGPTFITHPDGTVVDVSSYVNAPIKRPRGAQHLRNMSEAAIYELTVAIVVIRTLSGGIDKHIDWDIVAQIFPDENLDFLQDRWKTIRSKFRRDIAALTENLHHRFCRAYVEGEVPDLDFDDIFNNDWEGIVNWAVQNLDKSCVRGIEDLPDTREELADTTVMGFEEQRGMREYLGYNVGSSLPIREAAQASTVFAKPVECPALAPPVFSPDVLQTEDQQLRTAKSWALATVLTPDEKYDAYATKKKLSKLANTPRASEALFDRAEKSLRSQKTIFLDAEAPNKVLGRKHKPSKLFYDAIDARRTVPARVLRQAAHYKRETLDPPFRAGRQVTFQPTAVQDGDMVAILNLLAHGRIRLRIGSDVPKNRYGLLTIDGMGSYQTRHLEKDRLGFTVLVEPVDGAYVFGNPLEMQLSPVPAIAEHDTAPIPLWVDIHGNFQDELWELVVSAMVGLISTRPGIEAIELVKTLSPSLTLWETEIVLQWLERSRFIEPSSGGDGHGWSTMEWWWLVCGGLGGWHLGKLS